MIGLTGGIACGKSTVSDYLMGEYGCQILDADIFAREALSPELPLVDQIKTRYGPSVLTGTGGVDRNQLGRIIFNDTKERQWLESIIHPVVRQKLIQGCDRYQTQHAIAPLKPLVLSIPLLFESRMEDLVTEIWVVTCPPEEQRQRLMTRNQLSEADADARILSQWPTAEKVKRATVVIDNSKDREHVYRQVDQALGLS